jgi:hypothetical protein
MEKSKCRLETRVLSGQSDEKVMPDFPAKRTKIILTFPLSLPISKKFETRKNHTYSKYCRLTNLYKATVNTTLWSFLSQKQSKMKPSFPFSPKKVQ